MVFGDGAYPYLPMDSLVLRGDLNRKEHCKTPGCNNEDELDALTSHTS